jgi:hypothetical protein
MNIKINCANCNKEFSRKSSNVVVNRYNFCCRNCFLIFMRKDKKKFYANTHDFSYQNKLKMLRMELNERRNKRS